MNTMMNTKHCFLMGLIALGFTTADTIAQSVVIDSSDGRVLKADRYQVATGDDGDQMIFLSTGESTVEVSIDGDRITAKVDGKEVPADRIRREDGRIVILDGDGDPIEGININVARFGAGGPGKLRVFGGPDADFFFSGEPLPVMMGITMGPTGPALQKHLGLDPDTTTIITGVYQDLPAYEAGLREHDIIVEVDGDRPADPASIREALRGKSDGEGVRLEVIQSGKRRQVRVRLIENDQDRLRDAKYLGSAVSEGAMGRLFPRVWGQVVDPSDPRGQQWSDLLVTPDADVFRRLPRLDMDALKDAFEGEKALPFGEPRIDGRLESLDERMADLEEMLNKLLERLERRGDR